MDFCFCIPIVFGCPNKIKQEGDGTPYVVEAKSRMWLELCWIPVIPCSSQHIWLCGICQWQIPRNGGYQPMPAGYSMPPKM
ncbi:hypothetical protein DNF11_3670 [Malassezia restricta CBS 7877]|uniref:Uncharacterized protein n=1 Tax=Malassezia restricta (strain ATCC 96810 / NBRC 103918 / CBS 7877) TaxID=425264 RepID=A0A3G2S9V2_MALR7|nr:hypothetical protein DNF11_3670 [Malassezia restricta CBS 7877]